MYLKDYKEYLGHDFLMVKAEVVCNKLYLIVFLQQFTIHFQTLTTEMYQ